MCGIFGTIGITSALKQWDFLKYSIIAGTVRGGHGTGLAYINNEERLYTLKQGVAGYEFLVKTATKEKGILNKALITVGHNRHATVGKHTTANAHPFLHGEIAGVHNGSLSSSWRYDLGKKAAKGADVDSDALIKSIQLSGIEETANKFHGAASLVWINNKEGTLNMWRNVERPMHFVKIKNHTGTHGWVYASEALMLDWMIEKADLKRDSETFETATETHYKFTVGADKIKMKKIAQVESKQYYYDYYKRPNTKKVININSKKNTKSTYKAVPEAIRYTMTYESHTGNHMRLSNPHNANVLCNLKVRGDSISAMAKLADLGIQFYIASGTRSWSGVRCTVTATINQVTPIVIRDHPKLDDIKKIIEKSRLKHFKGFKDVLSFNTPEDIIKYDKLIDSLPDDGTKLKCAVCRQELNWSDANWHKTENYAVGDECMDALESFGIDAKNFV